MAKVVAAARLRKLNSELKRNPLKLEPDTLILKMNNKISIEESDHH